MKQNVKNFFNELFSFKWLLFGITLYLFCLNNRNDILKKSTELLLEVNKWDFIINYLSNIYLILYLIFPVTLFIMIFSIVNEFQYTVIIRMGSYRKWIYSIFLRFFKNWSIIVVIWITVSLLLSIGIPYSSGWSIFTSSFQDDNSVTWLLHSKIPKPFIVVILQLLTFTMLVSFLQLFFSIVYVFTKKKVVIVSIGLVTFISSIASFKIFIPSLKWLTITNYLSLYHGILNFTSFYLNFTILFCLIVLCVFLIHKIDFKFNVMKDTFYLKIGIVFYVSLCILGIFNVGWSLKTEDVTIVDVLVQTFYGTTIYGYSYLSYIFYVIVFLGFLYFIQMFTYRNISYSSYYEIIRYKSLNKWLWSWFKKIIYSILFFIGFLLSISLIIFILLGFDIKLHSAIYLDLSGWVVLYHFVINGILQLIFFTLLNMIISFINMGKSDSIIMLGLLIVFMLPGFNFIPVGLNGFGHIVNGMNIFAISIIFLILIFIQFLILHYLLNKRDLYLRKDV